MSTPTIDPTLLTNCTAQTCSLTTSFYNYRISLAANITFLALFSLLTILYLTIWLLTRRGHFYNTMMTLGTTTEVIGYAARIWSFYNQWTFAPYIIQIICLTLAPAFFSAGVYICLAGIVRIFGVENSRVRPWWFTYIFVPCDAVALVLQAVGGAMAASSVSSLDVSVLNTGVDVLIAGLSWQVFTLTCFLVLCGDLALRIRRRCRELGTAVALVPNVELKRIRATKRFSSFLVGLAISAVLILWRCAYRVAELNEGFSGPLTYKQGIFIGFEGVLIVVAATLMAVLHPALCMGGDTMKTT